MLVTSNIISAQDDANKELLTLEVVAELLCHNIDEPCNAKVALGKLPAGSQMMLDLVLRNTSDHDIRFSGLSKKCSCSQFKPEKKLIPAHGDVKARLKLKVPSRSKSMTASNTVSLVFQENVVANIEFEFQLEGLLAFKELMYKVVFDSDDSNQSMQIPFLATAPIDLEQVQARMSDNLVGVKLEIKSGPDGGLLELNVPAELLVDGDLRGEIYLKHPKVRDEDCLWLMVKDARQSEISPKIILFHRSGNGLAAKAILRTGKAISGQDADETPLISCTFEDQPLEITTRKLGPKIYQVECRADAALAAGISESNENPDSTATNLNWKISSGKATSKLSTPFVVDQH